MTSLKQAYDSFSKYGRINKNIPSIIIENLNPAFELRGYQKEAITRFIDYIDVNEERSKPSQLLFHMATGSGKTLLIAANILYLYHKGYRNFLFFVNSTNIIEKTKENFLMRNSIKYLFSQKIKIGDKEVKIREAQNFETSNKEDITIVFTTIQELHSIMSIQRENSLTYEDFKDKRIVMISDEAHHINAWTKNNLHTQEKLAKTTWEYTVRNIFSSNTENLLLEYTATVDLDNPSIRDKYDDKIIYEYSLKEFRQDGFSKEVKVLQADLVELERIMQAIILSQFRRKIAEKHKIHLKPVILIKSRTIAESKDVEKRFYEKIKNLKVSDIEKIKLHSKGNVLQKAFDYFDKEKVTNTNLIIELKEDFSEEKCIAVNSQEESENKQLLVNSLEDKNNEIRCIFAVDKLNEGWDVLNLFDIVRLYDTRDSKGNKPGKTTIAEAQLIGRGARYFPFGINGDKFKRKFDLDPGNDLKIIEELYYHSQHNPRYIQELTVALKNTGIIPNEQKTINLKIKDSIKNTTFWKNGFIFVNKRVQADRSKIRSINDLDISKIYKFDLRSGFTQDKTIFVDEFTTEEDKITRQFGLKVFNETIIRKALLKLEFYKFNNLRKYFPRLRSVREFVNTLEDVVVELRSSKQKLDNLEPNDILELCVKILSQMENEIKAGYTEYEGTKLFSANRIKDVVKDKCLDINVEDSSDQEFGVPMSIARHDNLRLNLSNKDWYVYDENYGTSEEKDFVQFIYGIMEKFEQKYSQIFLLRNENLFKIYRFVDGKPIEPDFVLFLQEQNKKKFIQYQVFVEPKGTQLMETDRWKEDFLKQIEDNYKIDILVDMQTYRLLGMPFYNTEYKTNFLNVFNQKLKIEQNL